MPEVVETALRQPGSLQKSMELVRYDSSVKRLSVSSREDQISPVPALDYERAFCQLPSPMVSEFAKSDSRQGKRSTTPFCLRFNELKLSIDPLKLLVNL